MGKSASTFIRFAAAAVMLAVMVGGFILLWRAGCFHFETLRMCADGMRGAVDRSYALAAAVYFLFFIMALAAFMPVSAIFSVMGGFLFGWLPAVVLATAAITVGSALAFLLVRFLFGSALQNRYACQLQRFNEAVERDGARYLLASRLSLVFPFFLLNILAGLTKIPLSTFMWTTVVGSVPSAAVYALAGQELYSINSINDLFSPPVMAAFLLFVLLLLSPTAWRYIRGRRARVN